MIKIVVTDVDGVLTDGVINIGENGELFKSFDAKDGKGIVDWQESGREFVIVTSRSFQAVEHRASELNVTTVHQGVSDKESIVCAIASERDIGLNEIAYIGDDVSDLDALNSVGMSCCPADAVQSVRSTCDYVSNKVGGKGAVRDILDHLQRGQQTAVGVIPARYGSTRLPGKPLIELDGKPMIQHVYQRTSKATELDDVIVATDDDRIVDAVEAINGQAVLTDPNHQTGTDRVAEVAKELDADIVVNIQGDEPLIDPVVIDKMVCALRETKPSVVTPISIIETEKELEDENTVKVVFDSSGKALYFSRSRIPSRGDVSEVYKHIGLYGFETEMILEYVDMDSSLEAKEDLEQLRLLENGYDIQTVCVDYETKEVNVKSDIEKVEALLEENNEH